MTVVQSPTGKEAHLLALDAQTFEEIGRARLPHAIPNSFHGQFFSESTFFNGAN